MMEFDSLATKKSTSTPAANSTFATAATATGLSSSLYVKTAATSAVNSTT